VKVVSASLDGKFRQQASPFYSAIMKSKAHYLPPVPEYSKALAIKKVALGWSNHPKNHPASNHPKSLELPLILDEVPSSCFFGALIGKVLFCLTEKILYLNGILPLNHF